jgi:hypothetical protein
LSKKTEISVTESTGLELIIKMVNGVVQNPSWLGGTPEGVMNVRNICRTFHQMAQYAALPADMREDYAKAVVGTAEEWDKFCSRLPAKLWREWADIDPQPRTWFKPRISYPLELGDDWRWRQRERDIMELLEEIDARRLRECRVCQKIYLVSRIVKKTGGPYGCSPQCNNTLRQRTYREG